MDDSIVLKLVEQRVIQDDCQAGFLLDGYPRNLSQVKDLENAGINLDVVIEFQVDPSLIIERITGRRFHLSSGRSYHIKYNPPKVEGKDDLTGEDLVVRADDNEETVAKRLTVYNEQTQPLTEYYAKLSKQGKVKYISIDGSKSVEQVSQLLQQALS